MAGKVDYVEEQAKIQSDIDDIKIIISTISVSLFLSAFFAVKSVASIDEVGLFNANVEALADGEEAVTGHCEEKDKNCLAFCP